MKILMFGGTAFLGRHMVEAALARGHEVTLFNRGKSNTDLFPQLEKLHGDRGGDLAPLKGRHWDVVFDTSGYVPRYVRNAAETLKDVEHYTFVSSVSVYSDVSKPGFTEDAPLSQLTEATETVTGETYGALKALCEQAVEEVLPGRVLVQRAGLIVGPYDYMWRFPYWVSRIAQGGEILAPGRPERQIQLIDARDEAEWTVRMAEARKVGIFTTTGPDYILTMGQFLERIRAALGSDATFTWVSEDFLAKEEVGTWEEMPFWLPEGKEFDGMLASDVSKAIAAGLTFRSVEATARDTWEWLKQPKASEKKGERIMEIKSGLNAEKEQALLQKWRSFAPTV
jgi:2'-hydroxyisoflavone reductase